ncbi:MAG: hypothetical protein JWO13_1977 [Acidobacteriales bacterium]|nr:hypothetical protein [Terriglobales bacterium]
MRSSRAVAVVFLLAAIFDAMQVVAQSERPAMAPQNNTVVVGADGKFETAPDTAMLQFNIAAQENTSEAAYASASKAAERMRQALRAQGLDPKSAELAQYSLQPMYDYKSPKRRLVGFRATTSVSLKIKDFSKVGPLLTALSGIEETENQSINYTLENIDAAKSKAVEDAYQRARGLATTLAKSSGRTLGELSYASVDTFERMPVPMPMVAMKTMRAESAPSAPTEEFSPEKVTVTAHVNAIFVLR